MRVEFVEKRHTVGYGLVEKGQVIDVSKDDGAAFIANGVAKKAKDQKEK